MENYKSSDFNKMLFNPFLLSENTNLLSKFKELGKYSEFKASLPSMNRNCIIRYILYAFDRRSPLLDIRDVIEKRIMSASLSYWVLDDGRYSLEYEDVVRGLNLEVNAMIVRFCSIQANEVFTAFVGFSESLRKQTLKLMDDNEEDENTKTIIDNIKNLRLELKDLRIELLSTDEDKLLNRDLYSFYTSESLGISPEAYANK